MATAKEQLKRTREKMSQKNYRISNGLKNCSNCAHMEILDAGPYKGWCLCRPMDYFFANTTHEKAHVCDIFMEGSQQDGLIDELAALIIESNNATSRRKASLEERKRKLQADREECIRILSQQKGLFAGIHRRTLQKRINQINAELETL